MSHDEALAVFHAVTLASQFEAFVTVTGEDRREWWNHVYATFSSEHDTLKEAHKRLDRVCYPELYASEPLSSRLWHCVGWVLDRVKGFRATSS